MSATRTFGRTWWGRAWLDALEGRAVHDPNRLPRGRTYARRGSARDLAIEPGEVRATVRGSRVEPYEVLLRLRRFRDDEWEWVLDAIASSAAHAAAHLDGEDEPGIVDAARAAEVELLPRSGELRTACSCPDWAEPCKHAAAVCYLVADAIDADPFVLLRLRGLDRSGVLDAVRARRSALASAGPPPLAEPGVVARAAWQREPGPLPHPPDPPARPGRPAPWPTDPPRSAPFTAEGLRTLAADAARRAWRMRVDGVASGLDLGLDDDLARRWSDSTDHERRQLADGTGHRAAQVEAMAAAWRVAGAEGVRLLAESPWNPPVRELVAARELLAAVLGPSAVIQVRANRLTVDGVEQYRRGRDGRWSLFAKVAGRWELAAGPATDLEELVAGEASAADGP